MARRANGKQFTGIGIVGSTVLIILLLVFTCGCATRPHTYAPPNQAKVLEETRRVKEGVKKSRESAKQAKLLVEESQKSADKISVLSVGLISKLEDLLKIAPTELHPPLEAAKNDAATMQAEEEVLTASLGHAWSKQNETEIHLTETDGRIVELEKQQAAYHREALELAAKATEERNYRISAEKQLSSQRWFGWLWKIGAFLFIALLIAFFGLKALGKLGWAVGKIGIKAAI